MSGSRYVSTEPDRLYDSAEERYFVAEAESRRRLAVALELTLSYVSEELTAKRPDMARLRARVEALKKE